MVMRDYADGFILVKLLHDRLHVALLERNWKTAEELSQSLAAEAMKLAVTVATMGQQARGGY
jgi:hypothetical protein